MRISIALPPWIFILSLIAGAASAASSRDVLKGMSGPAKIIIAAVGARADADWIGFCSTGVPAIRKIVTGTVVKLIEEGMIDEKIAMAASGETTPYLMARCLEAAGGKSATQIHAGLSEAARLIVAQVKPEIGSDPTSFCGDEGSGIASVVIDIATRMVEDSDIDEIEAYDAVDGLTKYYTAFCVEHLIKVAGASSMSQGVAVGNHDKSDAMLRSFDKDDRAIIVAANKQMGAKLLQYCKTDNAAINTSITDAATRLIEQEKIAAGAAKTVARASAGFYPVYCRELRIIAVTGGG